MSVKRFGAAILHAGASTAGLQDKVNTKATLDKASGKAPKQQDQKQDQKDNKQQNKRQTQHTNEEMFRYIQRQQEDDRRRNPKTPPRK